MNCKIYSYPDSECKEAIKNIISDFSHKKMGYFQLHENISKIFKRYRIIKLNIDDIVVKLIEGYTKPIVHIESKIRSEGEYCPVCKSGIRRARYLRTNAEGAPGTTDLVSWMCLDCGCFYETQSPNL